MQYLAWDVYISECNNYQTPKCNKLWQNATCNLPKMQKLLSLKFILKRKTMAESNNTQQQLNIAAANRDIVIHSLSKIFN